MHHNLCVFHMYSKFDEKVISWIINMEILSTRGDFFMSNFFKVEIEVIVVDMEAVYHVNVLTMS